MGDRGALEGGLVGDRGALGGSLVDHHSWLRRPVEVFVSQRSRLLAHTLLHIPATRVVRRYSKAICDRTLPNKAKQDAEKKVLVELVAERKEEKN